MSEFKEEMLEDGSFPCDQCGNVDTEDDAQPFEGPDCGTWWNCSECGALCTD